MDYRGIIGLVETRGIYPRVIYKAVALYEITHLGFQSRFLVEYRPGLTSVRDEDQSLTNNCLGKDARHSTPEAVMRMLSVVSRPQFSCQMPVMK